MLYGVRALGVRRYRPPLLLPKSHHELRRRSAGVRTLPDLSGSFETIDPPGNLQQKLLDDPNYLGESNEIWTRT